ncbi:hypothetical protein A3A84_01350 [Candidatus Collierbacteria bacterium RIFCSPLOWO2_01_FULL_50_23]|uniref:POTRA domain-containing protein n=2 Tax=Candidatus Collieribacteriota TaxID=1752725 RepID=A0A1F5EXP1_9BACT|nr:MAG: hypothetical protein A2703_03245 [Candidatus Collierbacteria bacterium RIFCSPHIGHO2_01_FULL_50_25]OGD72162.1 MAG: hypothetical protein A3D09_00835 [Candidatus Collierbacteria bacterium RIFCSPHIGHO2_02_FULL_49_10]OGD74640.1 MAG: hypothetical protein A3A84_01350 [Candidatus Collierbacteria bacterium RIFCSPLOWO2_01_FULL_50_23]
MSSADIWKTRARRRLTFSRHFLLGPAITLILILTLIFFHQKYLIVKAVACTMVEGSCPEAIISLLDQERGHSFLHLNYKELKTDVLSTGLVDGIEFQTVLPGKLVVRVQPPALVYFVKTAVSEVTPSLSFLESTTSAAPSGELAVFVATTAGKTFQLLSTGELNVVDAQSNYYLIGRTIPSKEYLTKTFNWLYMLSFSSLKPEALYFFGDMIIAKQEDGPNLIMNFVDDPKQTILALQRLDQVVTINKPTVIDFRFSHPILK